MKRRSMAVQLSKKSINPGVLPELVITIAAQSILVVRPTAGGDGGRDAVGVVIVGILDAAHREVLFVQNRFLSGKVPETTSHCRLRLAAAIVQPQLVMNWWSEQREANTMHAATNTKARNII